VGDERLALPYRNTEFESVGAKLRSHNLTDRGYAGDKETTDAWATELGLEGWCEWQLAL
jgi:hypothetical protein